MRPHRHIVSDLNQIIELGPGSDHRIAKHGTIETRIGANFHLIPNHHTANLGNFAVGAIVKRIKAKPIRPNDSPTMNDHMSAKFNPRVEAHIGIKHAIIANDTVRPNIGARIDHHPVAQPAPRLNDRVGANAGGRAHRYIVS